LKRQIECLFFLFALLKYSGPQEEDEFVSIVPGDGREYDDYANGEGEHSGSEINGDEGNEIMIIELRDLVPGRESDDTDCGRESDDSDGDEENDNSDTGKHI